REPDRLARLLARFEAVVELRLLDGAHGPLRQDAPGGPGTPVEALGDLGPRLPGEQMAAGAQEGTDLRVLAVVDAAGSGLLVEDRDRRGRGRPRAGLRW